MRVILASASPRRRELLEQIGLDFAVRVSHVEERAGTDNPELLVQELSAQKAWAVLGEMAQENAAEGLLVIGADTVVAYGGGILGKPKDAGEAAQMLKRLQGNAHEVYTGVTLLHVGRNAHIDGRLLRGAGQEAVGNAIQDAVQSAARKHAKQGVKQDTKQDAKHLAGQNAGQNVPRDTERGILRKSFCERTKVHFHPMSDAEIAAYVAAGEPMDKAGAYGIQGIFARYLKGIEGDYSNVVGLPVGRLYQELKEWGIAEKILIK